MKLINCSLWTTQQEIDNAINASRWNAEFCLNLMMGAYNKLTTAVLCKEYNKAVRAINKTFDSIMSSYQYKKDKEFAINYWGSLQPIKLQEVEEFISITELIQKNVNK